MCSKTFARMCNAWSLPLALALIVTGGCRGHVWRVTHFSRPVTLTTDQPTAQLGQYTVRLVSIGDDGTAQIEVLQTHRTLTARPGEWFVSSEFGSQGLSLDSASKATGTAKFTLRGARYD